MEDSKREYADNIKVNTKKTGCGIRDYNTVCGKHEHLGLIFFNALMKLEGVFKVEGFSRQ